MRRTSLIAVAVVLAAVPLAAVPAQARISPEFFRRVVREHIAEIQACYEEGLARRRDLAGRVAVRWTIRTDGTVTDAAVQSSTLRDAAVEACIVARVASWRFPESPRGTVQVTYPFEFRATD